MVTSRFKDAYLSGSLVGSVKTSAVNSIVTGPASATTGDLCSYSDTTGKIISDSGIIAANVITASTNLVSGNLVAANGTKTVNNGGIVAANVVTNAGGTTTSGQVATFSGTPASGTLTNCTGLPISTGVSGLGSGVATMLGTFSSANIAAACTDETGSGPLVFANQPDFFAPKSSGLPLTVSYATQYDAWTASGSVFTSGLVTFPASSTTIGSVLKVRAWCQLNSWSAGGTITLRCGANGVKVFYLALDNLQ